MNTEYEEIDEGNFREIDGETLAYEWKHPKALKSIKTGWVNQAYGGAFYISKFWMPKEKTPDGKYVFDKSPYFSIESTWFPINPKPFKVKGAK